MNFECIIFEKIRRVGKITLNRPHQLNALNTQLMQELTAALNNFEGDDEIACILITGSEKAFAAGADVQAMKDWGFMDVYGEDYITKDWERLKSCRKPVVAAVAGYALGGGCELAMMCDIIIAAENAVFGQPEIRLGVLPGAGGTQRLPRAVGKAKAMDLCLTGSNLSAEAAERAGLISRVVPAISLLDEAMACAEKIAGYSLPISMMIKESINRSFESSLNEGLLFERRVFHSAFSLDDRREGMSAFLDKRKPTFTNR